MKDIKLVIAASIFSLLISCSETGKADGYGNFEATEITISAEANGKLKFLKIDEGQNLEEGLLVGLVDTLQLYLTKQQLLASKITVASKSGGVWSQISVLQEQLESAITEQQRVKNMFNENAASQRQLDRANNEVAVLKKQIQNVESQHAPIVNEVKSIDARIAQINDKIDKCKIKNPVNGTVLTQYTQPGEIVSFGKPLYKIANLDVVKLRVYVSEPQLANIKIGQEVSIKIDAGTNLKSYTGKIDWISDTAEFTPKIIQTKEERANLVYAVTVKVKNDGSLKIGMPAEMWISKA